mmetsp:Transcript_135615/g.270596  ORF Transcript_135615/g.270596 Transcript_135615/m.270596 type:complete len:408 (-) Transcript_135615:60-1283(-)
MLATEAQHFPHSYDTGNFLNSHAGCWSDHSNPWAAMGPEFLASETDFQHNFAFWKQQANEPFALPNLEDFSAWGDGYPAVREHCSSYVLSYEAGAQESVFGDTCSASCESDLASSRSWTTERDTVVPPVQSPGLAALASPIHLPIGPDPSMPLLTPLPAPDSHARGVQQWDDAKKPAALELPPGLLPPPGVTLTRAASLPSGAEGVVSPGTGTPVSGTSESGNQLWPQETAPGICISRTDVFGASCTRVGWAIDDLRGKLRASMGRALVSPQFDVLGFCNLRLMVFPDARDVLKNTRSRERKGIYSAMITKGPLHGALKLKADCLETVASLTFYLRVGSIRRGPFTYDFSDSAIHGCEDFGCDWLLQLDRATESLHVSIEVLDTCARVVRPSEEAGEPPAGARGSIP